MGETSVLRDVDAVYKMVAVTFMKEPLSHTCLSRGGLASNAQAARNGRQDLVHFVRRLPLDGRNGALNVGFLPQSALRLTQRPRRGQGIRMGAGDKDGGRYPWEPTRPGIVPCMLTFDMGVAVFFMLFLGLVVCRSLALISATPLTGTRHRANSEPRPDGGLTRGQGLGTGSSWRHTRDSHHRSRLT